MVKDINIHTIYEGEKKIFVCHPNKLLDAASSYYEINASDILLYAVSKGGKKNRIAPHDIVDLMRIEIVNKRKSGTMDDHRTLRSYFGGGSSKEETLVEKIMTKLKNNSTLTGTERKLTLEFLQNLSKDSGTKRKLEDSAPKPKMSHKKVQVHMTATNSKDSHSQTDNINFAPEENALRSEDAIIMIKRVASNGTSSKEEIAVLMNETFDDRRNFILIKSPPVRAVKEKYPLLFSVDEVKNELERIFYPGKCTEFIDNIKKFSNIILHICDEEDEIVSRTEKNVDRSYTVKQQTYAKCVGSILALPKLMQESLSFIHLKDKPLENNLSPYINASLHSRKELFFDNMLYKVCAEEQVLCEASNFPEAILCLMACFFIFNISYPESCHRTLTIFEKLYLSANDTEDVDTHTEQMIKLIKFKEHSR